MSTLPTREEIVEIIVKAAGKFALWPPLGDVADALLARLRPAWERMEHEIDALTDRNHPEPGALHYDECPYKPFADLPSWEETKDATICTCSMRHKAAYWKARTMIASGYRQIAEKERDALRAELERAAR